jgi:hypothetical protein
MFRPGCAIIKGTGDIQMRDYLIFTLTAQSSAFAPILIFQILRYSSSLYIRFVWNKYRIGPTQHSVISFYNRYGNLLMRAIELGI